jgi:lincosamide nucleotidyltransferase A/C/D/E
MALARDGGRRKSSSSTKQHRLALALLVRRVYRRIAASSGFGRVPTNWLDAFRDRLFAIGADDVLEVLDALDLAGCKPCVAGGWGIDALVGRQTRRHGDLDVIIEEGTTRAAKSALASVGYVHFSEGMPAGPHMPVRIVARDSPGRIVDVLPLDDAVMRDQVRTAPPPFSGEQVVVIGTILDRPVRCLSPAVQWAFHQGYSTRSHDRHDLPRLRGTLGG